MEKKVFVYNDLYLNYISNILIKIKNWTSILLLQNIFFINKYDIWSFMMKPMLLFLKNFILIFNENIISVDVNHIL